jgi:hypothetical protein
MHRMFVKAGIFFAVTLLFLNACGQSTTPTSTPDPAPTPSAALTPSTVPAPTPAPTSTPEPSPNPAQVLSSPPEFSLGSLVIFPDEVVLGSSVQVSAYVTNIGNVAGDYTVTLRFRGESESQKVTLSSGEKETVSFTVTALAAGVYNIGVNTLTGTLVVIPAVPAGYTGYTDRKNGFFIAYPEEWKKENVGKTQLLKVTVPQEDTITNFFIEKQTLTQSITAKEAITQYLEENTPKVPMFSVISVEELTINGVSAAKGTYTFSLFDVPIMGKRVALIMDNNCFFITCISRQAIADKYANPFDTVTNSFTLLPTYQQ